MPACEVLPRRENNGMFPFNHSHPQAKSTAFAVNFADGRTAYLWLADHGNASHDHLVTRIAQDQQRTGALPSGAIVGIKRLG
jgi:hypothetical protein